MTVHRHYEYSCAKHGVFFTMPAMPGSPPICPHCSEEERKREQIEREGLQPIREQLDRIEKSIEHLATLHERLNRMESVLRLMRGDRL